MHVYRRPDQGMPLSNHEHLRARIQVERSRPGVVVTIHADLEMT